MRDGIYTRRGWRPLPLQAADGAKKGRGLLLAGGVVCLGVLMLYTLLTGLIKRKKGGKR